MTTENASPAEQNLLSAEVRRRSRPAVRRTPASESWQDRGRPTGRRSTIAASCSHLDTVNDVTPSSEGCEDCLATGGRWVHLRMCMRCGHVGCCDNSPNRHATAHWHANPDHPLIRSYEPGEDWWWCYPDELAFQVEGAPPAPSHP